MDKIYFEVGAKAARLIGRENITDSDGALVELIKNAYDADASCVCVCFDMPFPYVPTKISAYYLNKYLEETDRKEVLSYYEKTENGYYQKLKKLSDRDNERLWEIMAKYNCLVIADNGCGMTLSDVKTKWMYIGTSDKEEQITSSKGRIKTGAKGIGRFALDKLSLKSYMMTQSEDQKMVRWSINWDQFEKSKLLNQVTAELQETEEAYRHAVGELLQKKFPGAFTSDYDWTKGTAIVLTPIREEWSFRLFEKVNKNLKSINPLGTVDPFKVFIKNVHNSEFDFETDDTAIDVKDYDYKITIHFDGEETLKTVLRRNEADIKKRRIFFKKENQKVDISSFWKRPFFQKEKYHREQYADEVMFERNMTKVLADDPAKIRNVGPFDAELFFVKSKNSGAEIIKTVPVRSRKKLLAKFNGVKIYRDKFKVRPYGDEGNYFDWLELGKRQENSPGGVGSQSGSWRVLAYQLIGRLCQVFCVNRNKFLVQCFPLTA